MMYALYALYAVLLAERLATSPKSVYQSNRRGDPGDGPRSYGRMEHA